MEKYIIIKNKNEEEAILDNEKKIVISEWYDKIYTDTLDTYYFNVTDSINPRKQYHIKPNDFYIVRKENKEAIIKINNKDNNKDLIISQWWNKVYSNGFIMNESEYYIVQNKNFEHIIFHKDNKNKSISNPWNEIGSIGLVDGTSKYFLIRNSINKVAICSIDDNQKEVQLSKWHDYIGSNGLINGKNNYYIVKDDTYKLEAIYSIDNNQKEVQLSDFWNKIEAEDLLDNKSEYYIVNRLNPYSCETQKNIFHINDRFYPISKWSYIINE